MRDMHVAWDERLAEIVNVGIGIFFPPRCMVCDELLEPGERGLHESCKRKLYHVGETVCYRCGRPVVTERTEFCYDCGRMSAKEKAHGYRQGKALYLYKGEIKYAMYRFKYSNRREYASYVAKEMERQYGGWIAAAGIEVIVPVPMYWKKEQKRGYNQAAVLARSLGRQTHLPVRCRMIRRVKDTLPQKELNDVQRKNNLKNAFQTSKNKVKYKKILVVDDIYTTGSTMEAVTKALTDAGASEVYCLSVCIGEGA